MSRALISKGLSRPLVTARNVPSAMAIQFHDVGFAYPGGDFLFEDVSFRVPSGECVALVGPNGVGKSTILRLLARDLTPTRGTLQIDGTVGTLAQDLGRAGEGTTVRQLLVAMSSPQMRDAGLALARAEERARARDDEASGIALAEAVTHWGEVGGYREEQRWSACDRSGVAPTDRRRPSTGSSRSCPAASASASRSKCLLDSDVGTVLLDEPDNFLDLPGQGVARRAICGVAKTDAAREPRPRTARRGARQARNDRSATARGRTAATSRRITRRASARNERLGDAVERWKEEERGCSGTTR